MSRTEAGRGWARPRARVLAAYAGITARASSWPPTGLMVGVAALVTIPLAAGAPPISVSSRQPAAAASSAPPPAAPRPARTSSKLGPPVLVGPCRVTLVGGKTIEGIAVFREPGRIRVMLEDGTQIAFDPAKVASIVSLADLEPAPPVVAETPPVAPSRAAKGKGKTSPAKAAKTPVPDARSSGTIASTPSGAPPAPRAQAPARSAAAKAPLMPHPRDPDLVVDDSPSDDPAAASGDAPATVVYPAVSVNPKGPRTADERDQGVAEIAEMLASAVNTADLEGVHPESAKDAMKGAGEEIAGPNAAEAGQPTGPDGEPPAGPPGKEDTVRRPKPEDLDATRPVLTPGFRFLGPKGDLPETPPPLPDFPRPTPPTVTLGASIWKPTEGFSSSAKWPKALAPATSFSNELSGWGKPTTTLGPRWWTPPPIVWPQSIFPEVWKPTDGFAKDQQQKTPETPETKK